ncbi:MULTISPECIES: tRNA (N(6)-L-threonylcarbamoyladenosine(37)-C(2))-methylthiotransferase MtaB [Petrimonas]|jgi:threonylcarbamoyladenosine tRNA methylthiotransferase MtaB|uniref:Threonylcarbamoyladenosine tRNA methylthiotransferase MtaB n=1 Tax=Petrimonas mucosa TaxID=1642646 RepID=A0A1G4G8W8_9BACT|nr:MULTISPECIES: tRNA (N(6)-L-threonylcarbamoyladenosine(37)-C(2))-methylthiotransferase MtaB [Petrimonas]MDD3560619.1 tRNA (N(6)-L-threonylcarbamoyladenosine(37)-C(2))-methylthiotransferase MtaB [Petrimonas mucosa]SCM58931.1 Threonylcarbamoyladenosine tRNA methylthiotransferase MtaB [Petrimonas mucosa]SFU27128.1 threonylcarbamoyladenosine tRNA methylthiotransferase MtaB [Porphyromonadaceae bacterium KHP3R9]HHT30330.1 tRNA (N(6)-L-threonylcarbamoyladenosine(37)-C(2))-methylthiotransferase MtaB 
MIDQTVFENKTAAYYTLGCKLNFAETSAIGKQLLQAGVLRARKGQKADICVINTCSVTELADKKGRQAIRKMIQNHPDAFVVVTGCYAQLKPDEVASIEGVDLVLGSEQKLDVIRYMDDLKKREKGEVITSKTHRIRTFVPSCSADDRTRYFLKVQDGCDYFCSFCTIPYARGRSRNGSIADLVRQAEDVVLQGGKEIVLTGVNIGDFGHSTGETFFDLIKALDEVEGIERFRISSIEPNLLTDEIIDFVAGSKRFAPHFHTPLQAGSDAVLKLMKRKYDTALFRHKIEKIKSVMPHAFIGVDVIVGLRGETDDYFDEGREFIESLNFSQLHVFTYSERSGTQALAIEHVVDPKVKHQRSKLLHDISDMKLRGFYESQRGTIRKVLFEHTRHGDKMYGFTENYVKLCADYDPVLVNRITEVKIGEYNEEEMAMNAVFVE